MTLDYKFLDRDAESLKFAFKTTKEAILDKLRQKILNIEALELENLCDITARQVREVQASGKDEWNAFQTAIIRYVARKNLAENQETQKLLDERREPPTNK